VIKYPRMKMSRRAPKTRRRAPLIHRLLRPIEQDSKLILPKKK